MSTRNIIVGIDGSLASRAALRWAIGVAAGLRATVAAVAVQRRTPAFLPATSMALLPHGSVPERPGATRAERLHAVVTESGGQDVAEYLLTGDPARELTRMAGPDDLIVVGAHGALTPASAMLGSVTSACLRHARCPVVVIPGKGM
ncbi:universal stress protein [Kibdelosporangium lantanae]